MKRQFIIITIMLMALIVTIGVQNVKAVTLDQVVINEFEQNPPGSNANKQWVEIYNPTSANANLSLWQIKTKVYTKKFTIPFGTIIKPNGYLALDFSGTFLSVNDEQIILLDQNKNEIDKTPISSDADNDEQTWQRYPNGVDTDSDIDWQILTPTKWLTNGGETLTCNVSPTSIEYGEEVTISGSIEPGYRTFIKIQYKEGGGDWKDLTITQSSSNGEYSIKYTPKTINTYEFRSSTVWDSGAISDTATLTITKLPSYVYILKPRTINLGDNVSVIGFISPLKSGKTIQLKIGLPNGTELSKSTSTGTEGYFNYTFQPDIKGTWNFTASWNGDDMHNGATSGIQYLNVKEVEVTNFFPMIALAVAPVLAGIALALGIGLRGRGGPSYPLSTKVTQPAPALKPAPKPTSVKKVTPPRCLFCKAPIEYIPERRKYYCSRCKMYL